MIDPSIGQNIESWSDLFLRQQAARSPGVVHFDSTGDILLLAVCVHAASITGKVVGVSDGDTITILTAAKE